MKASQRTGLAIMLACIFYVLLQVGATMQGSRLLPMNEAAVFILMVFFVTGLLGFVWD